MAAPGALDNQVGQVTGTAPDGTEYRQVLMDAKDGDTHVTPDGQTWVAVHEAVVDGKVTASPFTIHWKRKVLSADVLISQLKSDSETQRKLLNQLQQVARDLGGEANLLPSFEALSANFGKQPVGEANLVIIYRSDSKKNSTSIIIL
jgi:hypothetical protein